MNIFRDGFDAISLTMGVWTPQKLDIKGESLGHVHFAIDYLKNPSVYDVGRRVIVLGAGNVAIDVARTAIRNGAKEVIIMYRRGEENIPAEKHEVECAKIDGVKFDFYKEPKEITHEGIIYKRTDGSDEEGFEKADTIFISISQKPRGVLAKHTKDINVDQWGFFQTDENGMTSRPGVFASGDAVTGARTVVEAVAFSKKVAVAIEDYIQNKNSTCRE